MKRFVGFLVGVSLATGLVSKVWAAGADYKVTVNVYEITITTPTGGIAGGGVAVGSNFNIAGSSIQICNTGNADCKIEISCSATTTPNGWTIIGSTPSATITEVRLMGLLNTTAPGEGDYDVYMDTITSAAQLATTSRYAGDIDPGAGDLTVGTTWPMWLNFTPMDQTPATSSEQTITVTITGELP